MTASGAGAIPVSALRFLQELREHNNRDWFLEHKERYLQESAHMARFAEVLLQELLLHDQIETASGKQSLHRIYRDTRFSKDKTTYKTHWSGGFRRATKYRRGGYYFHVEPGNSFVAGGFWAPATADLKRIREDIAYDPAPLRKILAAATFRKMFGTLRGEQLQTMPRGFDREHEAADLLRYKQFLLIRPFSDDTVLSRGFAQELGRSFRAMRPFFDYMSEVLTTDTNGLAL